MISKWHWLLSQFGRRLWVRAGFFALLGVLSALIGTTTDTFLPRFLVEHVESATVAEILKILASSMLAVTTFSLGVMLSAYSAVTSNVTPRAAKLVTQDRTTQNVLATFIGSFLFAWVGLIALGLGAYGDSGRATLFLITLGVLTLIVVTLLRWVEHLSTLGRVGETTRRVEEATALALEHRLDCPCLGGAMSPDDFTLPALAQAVRPPRIGYVQHVDTAALQAWAEQHQQNLYIPALPGTYAHHDQPLVWILPSQLPNPTTSAKNAFDTAPLQQAFTLADERTFEQDPRFGFAVLAEIASRALSPAVNDAGTAIDVIGRQVRLLARRANQDETPSPATTHCPRLLVPALSVDDLFDDAFTAIARDGSGQIEVALRLIKGLQTLAGHGTPAFRQAAQRCLQHSAARFQAGLTFPHDQARLQNLLGHQPGQT